MLLMLQYVTAVPDAPVAASAVFAVFAGKMRSLVVSVHSFPVFPAWLLEHLQDFVLVLWR